jgi:hypothetical protein
MRRFSGAHARRPHEDIEAGTINTELVFDFEGVEFSDGTMIIKWHKPSQSAWESFPNFESFQKEHSHSQSSIVIYWVDPEPATITSDLCCDWSAFGKDAVLASVTRRCLRSACP